MRSHFDEWCCSLLAPEPALEKESRMRLVVIKSGSSVGSLARPWCPSYGKYCSTYKYGVKRISSRCWMEDLALLPFYPQPAPVTLRLAGCGVQNGGARADGCMLLNLGPRGVSPRGPVVPYSSILVLVLRCQWWDRAQVLRS